MFKNELLDKNVLKVKKIIFTDVDEIVGLIIPHYLYSSISDTAIKVVSLDGEVKSYPISRIKEIKSTKIYNKDMKDALDKLIKLAKVWNKDKYYLLKKTRGYTEARLIKSESEFFKAISDLSNVYNEIHKEDIEKANKKKERELKREQELKAKELAKAKMESDKVLREQEKELKLQVKAKEKELKAIMKNKVIPKFKNNGFIIVDRVSEYLYAHEYHKKYSISIYLNSEKAISKVKDIVGLINISRTNKYNASVVIRPSFDVYEGTLMELEKIFGDNLLENRFVISHSNDLTDEDWIIGIDIPSFNYNADGNDIDAEYLWLGYGSESVSFLGYLDYLKTLKWVG